MIPFASSPLPARASRLRQVGLYSAAALILTVAVYLYVSRQPPRLLGVPLLPPAQPAWIWYDEESFSPSRRSARQAARFRRYLSH